MRFFIILLFIISSTASQAGNTGWFDNFGNISKNSESKKWVNDFGGWLLVISDHDWKEKWNNPQEGAITFTEAREIKLGQKITILTLYKNPTVNNDNQIDIECDVKIIRPDAVTSYEQKNIVCAQEKLTGSREHVRLSYMIIDYVGEPGDPYGIWEVEVIIKDNNANVEIPLRNQFVLINTATLTMGNVTGVISDV